MKKVLLILGFSAGVGLYMLHAQESMSPLPIDNALEELDSDAARSLLDEDAIVNADMLPQDEQGENAAGLLLESDTSQSSDESSDQKPQDTKISAKDNALAQELEGDVPFITPTDSNMTFDIEKKRQAVQAMVERGIKTFEKESLDTACNLFSHSRDYIQGGLYLFLLNMNGTMLAHGEDQSLIWNNMIDAADVLGNKFIYNIIEKAKKGGGWTSYQWRNSTKVSYVQLVEKNGQSYVVGSGYYPQSLQESVVNLVQSAVALFNNVKQQGYAVTSAFGQMNYPGGGFSRGNLYLYALDFEGNIVVQADRPGLIGVNALNYKDDNGVYVNQEIINKLKKSPKGVWVEYISKRAQKRAYAQKVEGNDGKEYFIACGYYPELGSKTVEDLVNKGYRYMKSHGKSRAQDEFSDRSASQFRLGDLNLVVFDTKAKVVAHGWRSDLVNSSLWNKQDDDGVYYIRNMIQSATKEGSWFNAKVNNTFESTYVRKIDLGSNVFIIASTYFPVSKPEAMTLLAESGALFLKNNPREIAFEEFKSGSGRFTRGDLQLVVVDTAGLCYVYGDDDDLVWRNIIGLKDDDGRAFIKMFIDQSEKGPLAVKIKLNGSSKVNYVVPVEKDGKRYIVSSGFYQ